MKSCITSNMFQYTQSAANEPNGHQEVHINRILIVDDEPFNLYGLETVLNLA